MKWLNDWWAALSPFERTRFELTGWYLVMFSGLIAFFTYLTFDAKESAFVRVYTVVDSAAPGSAQVVELNDRFDEFNTRFRRRVFIFDAGLLVAGALLSYFLSGKTLRPIQDMLTEQQAFASDVSHGLRTPLATMQLELETFVKTNTVPRKVGRLIDSVLEELQHLKRISEGVLSLTRSTYGTGAKRRHAINLNELVDKTVLAIQPIARIKRQNVLSHMTPEVIYRAHGDDIKQLLTIFIENGLKYSPPGSKVTVGLFQDRSRVKITIADTGSGIDKELLSQLFTRYKRGKRQAHIKGTGLGLAIAKKMVDAYGGDIQVKSKPGKGSVFSIILPKRS